MTTHARPDTRGKLLDAALTLVRTKGFSATSVDEICAAAGVTKGSFFHYFRSKEDLAIAAATRWSETTSALFAGAPYHQPADPLDRLLAYIDFRKALIRGEPAAFTCFVGTTVQEVHESYPAIRDACRASIAGHAATLEADIAAAMVKHGVAGDPKSLALHTQAVIQGAFILAKALQDPSAAIASVDHLRRYIELLFRSPNRRRITHDDPYGDPDAG
jgi:TetR/AcrR family transcriptional repressor of nem operon